MRAAVYARVSSAGQRDRHTIESQLREVPAYCTAQGWTVAATYVDDGRTARAGHLEARDGYQRLLVDARAGAFDVVVVVAVDRFTRSEDPVERAQVIAAVVAAGAQIAVVGAGIQDPRTFAGDAYLTLQALFAAEDNRKRRARVISGQITAAGRGRKPRGWTPYGLTYDARTGLWGADPDRAPIVREIVARIAAGDGVEEVARSLSSRGIPTPRGGRWSSIRVREIARSDTYVGRYTVDVERGLSVAVPPLVDSELATDARAALAARYRRPPPPVKVPVLLSGRAAPRCAWCGERIGVALGHRRAQYRCLGRRTDRYPLDGYERCLMPTRRAWIVDGAVWPALVDVLRHPQTVDRALAYASRSESPAPRPEMHRAEIDRLDRAQSSILAQLARGAVSQEVADAQIDRLARARREAQDALREAQRAASGIRPAGDPDMLAEALADLARGCELAGPDLRRRVAEALIERCVWRPESIAADLTIDLASQVDSSARRSDLPGMPRWRLGRLVVATRAGRMERTGT